MASVSLWMIKIVAITLGESASNLVSMAPLNLGYVIGAGLFLAVFAHTLMVKSEVDRFPSCGVLVSDPAGARRCLPSGWSSG
jgi:uncharacterized membrane-anchored protein